MNWSAQCAVVIPCLNEARTIGQLVTEIRRHLPRVIVVDDGSTDQTTELAQAAGAEVVRHTAPLGKGAALLAGWQHAHRDGFTWALCLDGDGQHAPEDIPRFLTAAERSGAPLIIGNRMIQATAMPWLRRQVNRWMSRRLSAITRRELPDSQCGFRLIALHKWAELRLRTRHFEIESELLVAFAEAGLPIEFVPVQVIYRHERSKIRPLRDSWRWWQWFRRVRSAGVRRHKTVTATAPLSAAN